jgi:hypothetical protein
LCNIADGDARVALSNLELIIHVLQLDPDSSPQALKEIIGKKSLVYDRSVPPFSQYTLHTSRRVINLAPLLLCVCKGTAIITTSWFPPSIKAFVEATLMRHCIGWPGCLVRSLTRDNFCWQFSIQADSNKTLLRCRSNRRRRRSSLCGCVGLELSRTIDKIEQSSESAALILDPSFSSLKWSKQGDWYAWLLKI